ncbi:class I SAM-dependent methyltransferase [bacterium]|nr:class I SAM-dependent methyltransferase [bacterium]
MSANSITTTRYYDENSLEYSKRSSGKEMFFLLDPFCERLPKNGRVLDLGAGPGRDSLVLTQRGYETFSLDLSIGMLQECRKRGLVNPVKSDFMDLPFRSEVFVGVWACASLLHSGKSALSRILSQVHLILAKSGVFAVSVKEGSGEMNDENGRFWTFYQEQELKGIIESCGFTMEYFVKTTDQAGRPISWLSFIFLKQNY